MSTLIHTDIKGSTALWARSPERMIDNIVKQNYIMQTTLDKVNELASQCLQLNEIGDAWHVECGDARGTAAGYLFALVASQVLRKYLGSEIRVRFGLHYGDSKLITILATGQTLLADVNVEDLATLMEATSDARGFGLNLSEDFVAKLVPETIERVTFYYRDLLSYVDRRTAADLKEVVPGPRSDRPAYFWFLDFHRLEDQGRKGIRQASTIDRLFNERWVGDPNVVIISSQDQGLNYNAICFNLEGYRAMLSWVGQIKPSRAAVSKGFYWKISHADIVRYLSPAQNHAARALYNTPPGHVGALLPPSLTRGWKQKKAKMKGLKQDYINVVPMSKFGDRARTLKTLGYGRIKKSKPKARSRAKRTQQRAMEQLTSNLADFEF